jgi:DNA-binding LytR/AlgR family response regulator
MYRVVIVDDEPGALAVLSKMLNNYFDFEVVGTFSTTNNLIKNIASIRPHVLFLDIHLGEKSGFDIARELYQKRCNTKIVFVSAFDKYAIQAFEYNIIDYLLKPVSNERLRKCIQKIEASFSSENKSPQPHASHSVTSNTPLLRFNTQNGFILVDPSEIVYMEADHVYTKIVMTHQTSHYVAQNLGKILPLIDRVNFLRISRSVVINVKYLREVNRTQRQCTIFDGDKEFVLEISRPGLKMLDDYFN